MSRPAATNALRYVGGFRRNPIDERAIVSYRPMFCSKLAKFRLGVVLAIIGVLLALAHAGCPTISDYLPRWFVEQTYNPKGGNSWAGTVGVLCILGGVCLVKSTQDREP
jgi:hypothetical protein